MALKCLFLILGQRNRVVEEITRSEFMTVNGLMYLQGC